jgi:hypothetical protein
MHTLTRRWVDTLHHKRLGKSTGALAGLAGAVSVLTGLLAAHYSPKGWSKVGIALHFSRAPLIVKLAPIMAAVAVALAVVSGVLHFYTWCKEGQAEEA